MNDLTPIVARRQNLLVAYDICKRLGKSATSPGNRASLSRRLTANRSRNSRQR